MKEQVSRTEARDDAPSLRQVRGALLPEDDAAAYLGLRKATLQRWRWAGIGPAFVKLGARAVRYRVADLDGFIEAGLRRSTSDTREAV